MSRLHGVVYPDPAPPAGGPTPEAAPDDENAMALRFVREGFTPPLPDCFAHWYRALLEAVREGYYADTLVSVPQEITDLGYTFDRAMNAADNTLAITLADALAAFGRAELLWPAHHGGHLDEDQRPGVVRSPTEGFTSLAAALMARGIRATVHIHRSSGTCTLRLGGGQALQVADLLIPAEGSLEDELGIALELLDEFVDSPRPTPCDLDHHGHCQEHHDDFADETRFAQHEGYAFLVRHNVREGT